MTAPVTIAAPKRHKYGAVKTVVDGITFPSKKEARRWSELKLLERAGEIAGLERQPKFYFEIGGKPLKFPNGRRAVFTADFAYADVRAREQVVEDVKGGKATRTEAYALRRVLFEALYPHIRFREV